MTTFADKYGKFLDQLENPNLTIRQQVVTTCGQGGHKQIYKPPTPAAKQTVQGLFDDLEAFDKTPTDVTFAQLQSTLQKMQMKAVRVTSSATDPSTIAEVKEWIYITPDADNKGSKTEQAKWQNIAVKYSFNLSYHVGSTSTVAGSDEHNGGDGCFNVVNDMVEQGSQLKLIMHNALSRGTSPQKGRHFQGDWAHSVATIDYPIMGRLARDKFAVIDIHGMASTSDGLLVNNWNSKFTKDQSFPTLLGIALAQKFQDKNFRFGGSIPGFIVDAKGQKRPLSPPGKKKTSADSIFYAGKGMQNTNVVGNYVNKEVTKVEGKPAGDSGHSVHIEFGKIRGKDSAKLRVLAGCMAQAMFWWNNYDDSKNPWKLQQTHPDIFNDMSKYGTLFPPMDAELTALVSITADDSTDADKAFVASLPDDLYGAGDTDVEDQDADNDNLDAEVDDPDAVLAPDLTDVSDAPDAEDDSAVDEYSSGVDAALNVIQGQKEDYEDHIKKLQDSHGKITAAAQDTIAKLKASEDAMQAIMDSVQPHLGANTTPAVTDAVSAIKPASSQDYAAGVQKVTDAIQAEITVYQGKVDALQKSHDNLSATSKDTIQKLQAAEEAMKTTLKSVQTSLGSTSTAVNDAVAAIKPKAPVTFSAQSKGGKKVDAKAGNKPAHQTAAKPKAAVG